LSFRKKADLEAASIPGAYDALILLGYSAIFDMPPVVYKRWPNRIPLPTELRFIKDADGGWWELAPEGDHLDVRWFGANMYGTVDSRAALEAAILYASPSNLPNDAAYKIRKVYVPEGKLRVDGHSIYVRGVTIEGATTEGSQISCQISTGQSLFIFDGGATIGKAFAGGGMRRLAIINGLNKVGGSAISVYGGDLAQAYESVFEDIKLTGVGASNPANNGKWEIPFSLNGSSGVSTPQGLRKVSLRNIFLGNPTVHGLAAASVGDLIVEATGVYGGTTSSNNFYVSGTPAAPGGTANLSNGVQFIGCDVDAALFVYDCEGFNFSGIANAIYFYSGAKGCAFNGVRPAGALTVLGQAGNVINAATW
jgi:hypothetical protein